MNTGKILLVRSLLFILFTPINAHAEFKYLDEVIIVNGFYSGVHGGIAGKNPG